ncbi:MAG: NAD(P)H-hydrate epimerase [bacterium]|nr:NAD(P)H-hydrate epimerase [bacterium]
MKTIDNTSLTVEDVRNFDEWAVDGIGMLSIVLMENAGKSVADEIYRNHFETDTSFEGVAVFCGTGYNGGAGLVAARHLFVKGVPVVVYIVGGISCFTLDTELNFRILKKLGIEAHPLLADRDLAKIKVGEKYLVVDAIFGVGVDRQIIGFYRKAIDCINEMQNITISVDVPSGFNADNGKHWGISIRANKTITMIGHKRGFESENASDLLGEVLIASVGIDTIGDYDIKAEEVDEIVEEGEK